jgi:Yip1 domain
MVLVERVKAILLTPKSEWLAIEREPGDPAYLFANYVAILAAIPAVCGFIGTSIIGISLPIIGTVRVGVVSGIASAIVHYLLAFAMVYVMGLIIDALAPTFNGQKNPANALKLAVYSMTPAWLAGFFSLIPGLRVFGILGLYGLYLLWVGLPPLMKVPEEKSIGYAAAVVVCAIVISVVIGAIVGVFTRIV